MDGTILMYDNIVELIAKNKYKSSKALWWCSENNYWLIFYCYYWSDISDFMATIKQIKHKAPHVVGYWHNCMSESR